MGGWLPWMDDPDNTLAESAYRRQHEARAISRPPTRDVRPLAARRADTFLSQVMGADSSHFYYPKLREVVTDIFEEWDLTGDPVTGRQKLKSVMSGEYGQSPLAPNEAQTLIRGVVGPRLDQDAWNYINDMDHPSMFDD